MIIKLSPVRRDDLLEVVKLGHILLVNGEQFDFTRMAEGDTLPMSAINSEWFASDVNFENGRLVLTLILPCPVNYSPEQAFPVDLIDVPDGPVAFPLPMPKEESAAKSEVEIDE